MIQQFVPSDFCLDKCRCCCRFSQQESIWSPCLLNDEIQVFLKNNIPPSIASQDKKMRLIPFPKQNNLNSAGHMATIFVCPFLNTQDGKCKIYAFRPFECQLYPFLINCRNKKKFLAVDLGCPFVKENLDKKEFKEYMSYLAEFLNNPGQLDILKDNPQIIQVYEDALDLVELKLN